MFTCLETKGRVRPGQYGFLDCSPTSTDGCLKCDCAMGKSTLQKCSSPEAAGVPPKGARKSCAPHGRGGRCASFTTRCSVRPDHPLPSHNPASRSLGALALPPPVIRGARVSQALADHASSRQCFLSLAVLLLYPKARFAPVRAYGCTNCGTPCFVVTVRIPTSCVRQRMGMKVSAAPLRTCQELRMGWKADALCWPVSGFAIFIFGGVLGKRGFRDLQDLLVLYCF